MPNIKEGDARLEDASGVKSKGGFVDSWTAYGAALWGLIFAGFHVIWAAGWYVGLDAEQAKIAFSKTPFFIYDLIVAGICVVAVPVALALAMPWGRRLPRSLLGLVAWTGSGLLVIRSVASIAQTVYLIAAKRFALRDMGIWEPWFYLGATLFTASAWRYWRRDATDRRRRVD